MGCHKNTENCYSLGDKKRSKHTITRKEFLPLSITVGRFQIPYVRLGRKSSQKTMRSSPSLLSTLGSATSITKYFSPSVVKAGQLM